MSTCPWHRFGDGYRDDCHLCRKALRRHRVNLFIGGALVGLAVAGFTTILIIVVLNGLRLFLGR